MRNCLQIIYSGKEGNLTSQVFVFKILKSVAWCLRHYSTVVLRRVWP